MDRMDCPGGDPCPGTGCPACCPSYDPCGKPNCVNCAQKLPPGPYDEFDVLPGGHLGPSEREFMELPLPNKTDYLLSPKYWDPVEPEMVRAAERQMRLYSEALQGSLTPLADVALKCGLPTLQGYAERDAAYTMQWWQKYSPPLMVNKLRGKHNTIQTLNDLIHPDTLDKMTRPMR